MELTLVLYNNMATEAQATVSYHHEKRGTKRSLESEESKESHAVVLRHEVDVCQICQDRWPRRDLPRHVREQHSHMLDALWDNAPEEIKAQLLSVEEEKQRDQQVMMDQVGRCVTWVPRVYVLWSRACSM